MLPLPLLAGQGAGLGGKEEGRQGHKLAAHSIYFAASHR